MSVTTPHLICTAPGKSKPSPWFAACLAALVLSLSLATFATRRTAQSASSGTVLTAGSSFPQFAVADFDGDRRPDMARVEYGQDGSLGTQYWIQLQLTHSGWQLIGVVAPFGGLRVAASDVNGDHAVDLVLTTAWLNRPVAILLNDGHGRFRAEQPSAFPAAFDRAAGTSISHGRRPRGDTFAFPSRAGLFANVCFAHVPLLSRSCPHFGFPGLPSTSPGSQRGRAPPIRS
jgi:hypothetical protein